MNQARTGHYYAEDFEPKKRIGRWVWLVVFLALIASYIAIAVLGAYLWHQHANKLRAQLAAEAPKTTRAAPATALTQWDCSDQEFREHLHACKTRSRTSLIKQLIKEYRP